MSIKSRSFPSGTSSSSKSPARLSRRARPGTVGFADGIAFILQNDARGTNTLGGGGGSLGYSGVTPSAAFEINVYTPQTRGFSNQINGATGGYSSPPGINFTNSINVTLQ